MTFDELRSYVYDIENDPSRSEVRFGCECGCGGDSYTIEEWETVCNAADVATQKLEELGITFD